MKFEEKLRPKIEPGLNHTIKEEEQSIEASHFRPWAAVSKSLAPNLSQCLGYPDTPQPNPAEELVRHPAVTTLHRMPNSHSKIQDQPLALLAKKTKAPSINTKLSPPQLPPSESFPIFPANSLPSSSRSDLPRPPASVTTSESLPPPTDEQFDLITSNGTAKGMSQPRNYKNMTRERRIEANARERTRVHTISAAFDTLRRTIPSYSNTQKLSKLSVLRVACSYILTLSRIAGSDYSIDQSEPTVADCVDEVTKTIQTEGKIRKKKDE